MRNVRFRGRPIEHSHRMTDVARCNGTPKKDNSYRKPEEVITPKRQVIREKLQMLNMQF
jgi:hypothetical protein